MVMLVPMCDRVQGGYGFGVDGERLLGFCDAVELIVANMF